MSRSVASTRVSAQLRSASRPKRRISSTKRSSAASASFNSPPSPSTASTIDETRFRSSGCARKAAVSASSLNSKPSIRILLLNQSKPNLPRIALNRTRSAAFACQTRFALLESSSRRLPARIWDIAPRGEGTIMTDNSADQAGKEPRRLATLACATALLTALCGSPVRADTATPNTAEAAPVADYSDPAHWTCRPGRADACAVELDATIIAEDGSMTREAFHADPDAPIDCFYVYPTVSREPTGNADFAIDRDLTRTVVQQFARFGARCRLFAPVYRQITIPGLIAEFSGKPMPMSRELAYADVLAAWRSYLANDNHGRGFVLVGHSQGAGVLSRLVREELDGKPIQGQMVSALLMGGGGWLPVKPGDASALIFPHTPLCRTNTEIGCIIGFSSFRAEAPPTAGTLFEKAPEG